MKRTVPGLKMVGRFTLRCACGGVTSQRYALTHGMQCAACFRRKNLPADVLPHLSLTDDQLEVLDRALTAAEKELRWLVNRKFTARLVADLFATHARIHLATELANIKSHGHRNDFPEDVPGEVQP